jgi:hypothetical protein
VPLVQAAQKEKSHTDKPKAKEQANIKVTENITQNREIDSKICDYSTGQIYFLKPFSYRILTNFIRS